MTSTEKTGPQSPAKGSGGTAVPGLVVADRITRIRTRLASGRYPLDVVTLADALVELHVRKQVPVTTVRPFLSVGAAVAEQLAGAIRAMDSGAMLVLQLEFIEQLRRAEIAALFDTDVGTISAIRQSALTELSARLSAA